MFEGITLSDNLVLLIAFFFIIGVLTTKISSRFGLPACREVLLSTLELTDFSRVEVQDFVTVFVTQILFPRIHSSYTDAMTTGTGNEEPAGRPLEALFSGAFFACVKRNG